MEIRSVFGFVLAFVLIPTWALAFEVHQLTDGIGSNDHPSVDDGHVVWVNYANFNDEIMISNVESPVVALTTLTDDGGEKDHPSNIGSTKIVWQGRPSGGDDWEIYLYFKYGIPRWSQFTDNEIPDRYPSLGVGGNFAWLSGLPVREEIHYWNEAFHSESVISTGCCPTSSHSNERPSYDDYGVVWRAYDRINGGGRFYYWSGFATKLEIPDGSAPSLYENTFAYVGLVGLDRRIVYWDGDEIHTITDHEGYAPSLVDGRIAYERWDGRDWEIAYWDGAEILEITDNDYNDTQPSFDGNTIAWVGRPESFDEIFYVTGLPEPDAAALSQAAVAALVALAAARRRTIARS